MARRSKLGQWTSSASAKSEVLSPAVSLSVQRVTVPLVRSSEYASAGARAELRVKPSSAALLRQRTSEIKPAGSLGRRRSAPERCRAGFHAQLDRKSTRLNSSHVSISYAVFCLKKKNDVQMTDQA